MSRPKPKIFGRYCFNMYQNTLAPKTKKLLDKLSANKKLLADFRLAGGTALALQYGHRQSIDLDWFTIKHFDAKNIIQQLAAVGKFELLNEDTDTVDGVLDGVKITFLRYSDKFIEKPILYAGAATLATARDIALMKLGAISGRNTKKDFIDLFIFLNKEKISLKNLVAQLIEQKSTINFDAMHLYKSLVYFEEADQTPMPKILTKISWLEVKKYFLKAVGQIN